MDTRPSPRPQRTRRGLRAAVLAALAVAVTGIGACEAEEASPQPPPTAGLVLLSGEPGNASLRVHDERGTDRALELPSPTTAWISAGPDGRLVATLDDGTLRISDAIAPAADVHWSRTPGPGVDLPKSPLFFATWAPDGGRAAAIAAEFFGAGRLTLVVLDPDEDGALLLPVPRRPAPAPPAWIADDQVLLQVADGSVIVDVASGNLAIGPRTAADGGIPLAVAVGSGLVALAPEAGRVEIRELGAWLAGVGDALATIEREAEIGSLAFDAEGERLAVVWQRPDGPGLLSIHRAADGWQAAHEEPVPGESARAVVDWLRPAPASP